MSVSISIETNVDGVLSRLKPIEMDGVKKVAGRALANQLRGHFFKLNAERPNQMGGARTNFYSQAARGVQQPEVLTDGVKVSINQVGIAQRYFGGTIHPVTTRFLTIPARAEAYGRRAGEFNNLRFAVLGAGGPALVKTEATEISFGRKRKKGQRTLKKGGEIGGEVMFWLRRSVTQRADPTVLPSEREIAGEVGDAIRSYVTTRFKS